MDYAELLRETRRRALLNLLAEAPACQANDEVAAAALDATGYDCTRDQAAADLAWLADLGLVRLERVEAAGLCALVASLTPRGLDVARGKSAVPGIRRFMPGGGKCRL